MTALPPDVEIAQAASLKPVEEVASRLALGREDLETYGNTKAKLTWSAVERARSQGAGKLVLVTGMTPTRAGEGKTVTTIGLGQALARQGEKVAIAVREPSLGPTFGIKGGAAGGGYSQVLPMEEINLHFTGDLHAITSAHNLLSAMVDNHAHFETEVGLPRDGITWRRVLDVCDRQLRFVGLGGGSDKDGFPHDGGFDITAASEVMAVLSLARDYEDLEARLSRMVVGRRGDGSLVTAGDVGCVGAMAVLLRDALKPNLVQTIEHTPALVHCGPFANVAHGCNSLVATQVGMGLADWTVTEAGFGADLGAEKFLHLKCRALGTFPAAAVLVATVRALKMHGGKAYDELKTEDVAALESGFANLRTHVENLRKFDLPVVVALNVFPSDTEAELGRLEALLSELGAAHARSYVAVRGGEGGSALADAVKAAAAQGNRPITPLYELDAPLTTKIETVATEIYRADGVEFSGEATAKLAQLTKDGFGELPICVAKTQASLSDDGKK